MKRIALLADPDRRPRRPARRRAERVRDQGGLQHRDQAARGEPTRSPSSSAASTPTAATRRRRSSPGRSTSRATARSASPATPSISRHTNQVYVLVTGDQLRAPAHGAARGRRHLRPRLEAGNGPAPGTQGGRDARVSPEAITNLTLATRTFHVTTARHGSTTADHLPRRQVPARRRDDEQSRRPAATARGSTPTPTSAWAPSAAGTSASSSSTRAARARPRAMSPSRRCAGSA